MHRVAIYSKSIFFALLLVFIFTRYSHSNSMPRLGLGEKIRESQLVLLVKCTYVEDEIFSIEFDDYPGEPYTGTRYGHYEILEIMKGESPIYPLRIDYKLTIQKYPPFIEGITPKPSDLELYFGPRENESVILFVEEDSIIQFGIQGKVKLNRSEIPLFRDAVTKAIELDNADQDQKANLIIDNLKSDNKYIIHIARDGFWGIDRDKYVLRIAGLLKSEDESIIRLALDKLMGATDTAITKLILPFLNDDRAEIRERSARVLGSIPDERSIAALIESYNDPDSKVRGRVISALLHQYRAAKSIPRLERENVFLAPVGGYGNLDRGAYKDSVLTLYRRYSDQTTKYREQIMPLFYDAAEDTNSWVRRNGLQALGVMKEPQSTKILTEALKDDEAGIRKAAASALRSWPDRSVVKPLGEIVCCDTPFVRLSALHSLRSFAEKDYIDAGEHSFIIECLREVVFEQEDDYCRSGALYILGKLKDPFTISSLPDLLYDDLDRVRNVAIEIIRQSKNTEYLPHLIKALKNETNPTTIDKLEYAIKNLRN